MEEVDPRELLRRGELALGERVGLGWPEAGVEVSVRRVGAGKPKHVARHHAWVEGLYYATRHHDEGLPLYLWPGGKWETGAQERGSSGEILVSDERETFPGYFDSLPELLDSLFVAALAAEGVESVTRGSS